MEVSSVGKTDLQKFCVEAESWQRALQAARAQRGEEGPMSGFSIELLEEGYRAVDPVARVKFVVKRAPDDMPVTAPLAKDAKGVAPSPAAAPAPAATEVKKSSPPPSMSPSSKKSIPPRPSDKSNGPPSTKKGLHPTTSVGSSAPPPASAAAVPAAPATVPDVTVLDGSAKPEPPRVMNASDGAAKPKLSDRPPPSAAAAPIAVGSQTPGLPVVKVLTAREQNPTDASPLTYREYSFAVPPSTSEDVAVAVLKAQLQLVDAHLKDAKMGKLVNLAVFDVEFTGKPPGPPIATLTWKDWKGEPVIGYPRRGAAQKQIKPPTGAPAATSGPASSSSPNAPAPPSSQLFPAPTSFPNPTAASVVGRPISAPPPAMPVAPPGSIPPPPASVQPQAPAFPAPQAAPASVPPPPPAVSPSQPPPIGAGGIPVPVVAPVAVFTPSPPPGSVPPPPPMLQQPAAAVIQPVGLTPSSPPPGTAPGSAPPPRRPSAPVFGPDGTVRTPSGRFVRGRTTGDELITALFESMHDLHFLRDALDGGQFCLALATEVLPARAALIHFFDVEKREWIVACTRGKDTGKLLTMRTPESDELLREAARKRRAVVTPNASAATAQRYQTLGGSRSMIIAPIMQAGRALGAIEIINPLDGMPFTEDEGNAMTYIAEQYAEYLGSRGIIVNKDRIQSAATAR